MAGFDHSQGQGIQEVTVVEVRNPITHNGGSLKSSFTDYEICIKTTSKAFIIPQSFIRRRYSDFVWLRSWLEKQNDAFSRVKTPKLPPKKLVGRTNPDFIQIRMRGLQKFLRKIIEHNVFLSDKALHLFLQSGMKVKQIESYLNCGINETFVDNTDALVSHFEQENKQTTRSVLRSITESIPTSSNDESNDGSSYGKSYSSSFSSISTSSLLDSFEAINVEDCEPKTQEGERKQNLDLTGLLEEDNESDKDSLIGLDGKEEDISLLDDKDKEQSTSNNSLAECDRET